jgi:hypothetical protein
VALALAASSAAVTVLSHRFATRKRPGDDPVRRYGWMPLISQAGLTLGLGAVIERSFPVAGAALQALVIAVVALNEVVGPVLFKLALERSGEASSGGDDASS